MRTAVTTNMDDAAADFAELFATISEVVPVYREITNTTRNVAIAPSHDQAQQDLLHLEGDYNPEEGVGILFHALPNADILVYDMLTYDDLNYNILYAQNRRIPGKAIRRLVYGKQVRFYLDTVDVYAPISPTADPITGQIVDPTIPTIPTYANVACRFFLTDELDGPEISGRTKVYNIFTLDRIHFPSNEAPGNIIGDGWVVQLKASRQPLIGKWWYIQGNSNTKIVANTCYLFAKRGPAPRIA